MAYPVYAYKHIYEKCKSKKILANNIAQCFKKTKQNKQIKALYINNYKGFKKN